VNIVSDKKSYDLAVAYRICPQMSRTPPPVFADSKYKLSALCLRSFKNSLGDLKVKMWVILDKCPPEYETLVASLWPAEDLVLVRYPDHDNEKNNRMPPTKPTMASGTGTGTWLRSLWRSLRWPVSPANAATFHRQVEILAEQNDAEFVFLAEDDYFYLPGCFHLLLDLMKKNRDVDFCTPADHPDLHKDSFHQHKMRIKVEQGQAWKTANGTTGTLATRKSTLQQTLSTLLSLGRNTDAGMWLSLTKHHVFNPCDLLTQPFIFPYRGASLAFAWLLNWRQILFGRRYTLFVPVPSIATHMDAKLLAPYVDWKKEFQQAMLADIQSG
jgi:hypothetical protein